MPSSSYFVQECPTCGRNLQVRVHYLGKSVTCRHCRGQFVAFDTSRGQASHPDSGIGLLQRANHLLDTIETRQRETV